MIFMAFLFPLILGFLAVSLIGPRTYQQNISFGERLGLGFFVGAGLVTLSLFVMNKAGFALSSENILYLLYAALTILCAAYLMKYRGIFSGMRCPRFIPQMDLRKILSFFKTKENWFFVLLCVLLAVQIIFIFMEARIRPIYTWDDIETWGFKGKAIYENNRIAWEYFHYSRPQYPLHLPLFQAYVAILGNEWNEAAVKLIYPLYYLFLLIVFFCETKRFVNAQVSLFFTFFLATLPELAFHSTISYSDLVNGAHHAIAAFFLMHWLFYKNKCDLIFWGIFGGLSVWTKLEGLMFFFAQIVVIAVYVYREKKWDEIKYFAYNLILPVLFYFITRYEYRGYYPSLVDARLKTFGLYMERFVWLFDFFWQSILVQGSWSLLWAGVLFYPFKIRELWKGYWKYAFSVLLSYLFFFFMMWVMVGTREHLDAGYISTSLNRILLNVVVLLVFFHAIVFGKILESPLMIQQKSKPAWQTKGNPKKKFK